MKLPVNFYKPLAIGAPQPLRELPVRPERMIHFFPPHIEKIRAKAPETARQCDVMCGNLEDAIPIDAKDAARAGFIELLASHDFGDTAVWVRINALNTPWVLDDLEQIIKQLNKIIEVIKVRDLNAEGSVIRELCLIKTHVTSERSRSEIIQYANIFRGRIVDAGPENLTLEITGTPEKIDALIDLLRGFGIKEISRTGPTAISRGSKTI